jgi:hypothetical protein
MYSRKAKENKKMKTYTEEEIKKWFDVMMKKYPNSAFNDQLQSVKDEMFPPKFYDDINSLEKVVHNG